MAPVDIPAAVGLSLFLLQLVGVAGSRSQARPGGRLLLTFGGIALGASTRVHLLKLDLGLLEVDSPGHILFLEGGRRLQGLSLLLHRLGKHVRVCAATSALRTAACACPRARISFPHACVVCACVHACVRMCVRKKTPT